jgi:hypothetical protein
LHAGTSDVATRVELNLNELAEPGGVLGTLSKTNVLSKRKHAYVVPDGARIAERL